MRLSLQNFLGLLPLAGLAAAAGPEPGSDTVTFRIPPSHILPGPHSLPPSTHATLSAPGGTRSAALSSTNTFVFRNVSAGSYLVDVHCPTHAFAPLRLDVAQDPWHLAAWESYRGNAWDNKGEALRPAGGVFDVRVVGAKGYYMERSKFSVFSILRNPMILLSLVSLGIFIGMPYMVNNMDPEMKAEWEERQKSNPMNNIMNPQANQSPMGGFDMAAYLAGSSKKSEGNGGASSSGNGNGGKKRR